MYHMRKITLIVLLSLFLLPTLPILGLPSIKDEDLVVKEFVTDLALPTTMTFVDSDILVLQKNDGKVRLVRDGILQDKPILDLKVSNKSERGLLGITSVDSTIYLYLTESDRDGGDPFGNRIYQYHWNGESLIDPILIKDLPATPGPNHDGGAMVTGPDGEVFAVIGDLNRRGPLQNFVSGDVDDTGVILQLIPEEKYYAMGIRNSFGLAIDPYTGNLWDTENGPDKWDEINLVPPGFNSGWRTIMGPATTSALENLPGFADFVYSDPEFAWRKPVAPTALSFINSESFEKYQNNLFVGACNNGILYNFKLNPERNGFVLEEPQLTDLAINEGDSVEEIVLGRQFGCITDIEVGPDGYLYVVSLSQGAIYQIHPKTITDNVLGKDLGQKDGSQEQPEAGMKVTIPYQEISFEVTTSLSNGSVQSGDVVPHLTSVILMLETSATEDGELIITLPRELIDAKFNGADGDFVMFVDGEKTDYQEYRTTENERAIKVPVFAGAGVVEIIGTKVVPEFSVSIMAAMGALIIIAIVIPRFKNMLGNR